MKCDQDLFPETRTRAPIFDSSNPANSSVAVLRVEELSVVFEVGILKSFRSFSVFPSGWVIGLNCSLPDLLYEACWQKERVRALGWLFWTVFDLLWALTLFPIGEIFLWAIPGLVTAPKNLCRARRGASSGPKLKAFKDSDRLVPFSAVSMVIRPSTGTQLEISKCCHGLLQICFLCFSIIQLAIWWLY